MSNDTGVNLTTSIYFILLAGQTEGEIVPFAGSKHVKKCRSDLFSQNALFIIRKGRGPRFILFIPGYDSSGQVRLYDLGFWLLRLQRHMIKKLIKIVVYRDRSCAYVLLYLGHVAISLSEIIINIKKEK